MTILWPFCLGLAIANQIIIKDGNLFVVLAPIVYLSRYFSNGIIYLIFWQDWKANDVSFNIYDKM